MATAAIQSSPSQNQTIPKMREDLWQKPRDLGQATLFSDSSNANYADFYSRQMSRINSSNEFYVKIFELALGALYDPDKCYRTEFYRIKQFLLNYPRIGFLKADPVLRDSYYVLISYFQWDGDPGTLHPYKNQQEFHRALNRSLPENLQLPDWQYSDLSSREFEKMKIDRSNIQEFLRTHPKFDFESTNRHDTTVLQCLIWYGFLSEARELVERGADLNRSSFADACIQIRETSTMHAILSKLFDHLNSGEDPEPYFEFLEYTLQKGITIQKPCFFHPNPEFRRNFIVDYFPDAVTALSKFVTWLSSTEERAQIQAIARIFSLFQKYRPTEIDLGTIATTLKTLDGVLFQDVLG